MSLPETAHAPSESPGEIPVSFNQEFLCLFDQGDTAGPFGPRYHLANAWRMRGELDLPTLRAALDDLVERHATLRTTIVRGAQQPYQKILPPSSPELVVRDFSDTPPAARDGRVEDLLDEVESHTIEIGRPPLLRATLGRFDDRDWVLVLFVHHSATDGWSMRVLMRDLALCYAARRGYPDASLPDMESYGDFAVWQRANSDDAATAAARAFWRENLRGARIFTLPTDTPRSANLPPGTAVNRFRIDGELMSSTADLARSMRCSPFMVLLAAFHILASRMTGSADLTIPTFSPGRAQGRFDDTVGSFFNFLPLRTDIAGCASFREVVARIRGTCLDAFSHDIPSLQIFAEAPELMQPAVADDAAPVVFQAFPLPFLLDSEVIGDVEYTEARRRLRSQEVTSEIPDGALWTLNLDPVGDAIGFMQYRTNLYDKGTIDGIVAEFGRILRVALNAPDTAVESL